MPIVRGDYSRTVLLSHRLELRPWRDTDIDAFAEHNADPRVMRYFTSVMTREETEATVARWQALFEQHDFCFFAVDLQETGEFIGTIGCSWQMLASPFAPAVEVGWRLHPDTWGSGFATEGALASMAYVFDTNPDLDEIVALTVPDYGPSRAVMDRLQMTHDPADDFVHPYADEPHVLYRMSRHRFTGLYRDRTLYTIE
jgi:RimJ/RimL family protein N-acetyltransferase